MRMPVDADVAGILARAPRHAAEVAEQRGRLMLGVGAFELEAGAQKGIAAAGIEQIARAELLYAAVDRACLQQRLFAVERDLLHADLFACIHARRARALEQHLVELRTRHLEGEIGLGIERVRKKRNVL